MVPLDDPGPDPDHRCRAVRAGDRQRVCHVDDDQRPPAGADHRPRATPSRWRSRPASSTPRCRSPTPPRRRRSSRAPNRATSGSATNRPSPTPPSAVTRASSGLTDEPLIQLLGRINANLAVYTGLVGDRAHQQSARANPVGSSYLSEASSLMQQTRSCPTPSGSTRKPRRGWTRRPRRPPASRRRSFWWCWRRCCSGAFANRWLARRTRRRVNIGFVAGGLAVLDHVDLGGHRPG